jgi:hypothetical protein
MLTLTLADAVAFGMVFARLLEKVILGGSVEQAIDDVTALLQGPGTGNTNDRWFGHGLGKMREWRARPPFEVTLELGQACDFPFHVFTAPQLLLHGSGANTSAGTGAPSSLTFAHAVRETIKIGGENANRGSFIGALLAAAAEGGAGGEAAIPADWKTRTSRYGEMRQLAERIVDGGKQDGKAPLSGSASESASLPVPVSGAGADRVDVAVSGPYATGRGPGWGNSPGCIAHGNSTTSNATQPPSHPDDIAG